MRRMKRWIRRRLRAWLDVESDLAQLRGRVHALEQRCPKAEIRPKEHPVG